MIQNNLEVSINIDLINLSDEQYAEIIDWVMENMRNNGEKTSFKELDEMFKISPRNYVTASLEMPELNREDIGDEKWRHPKTTKIDIRG